MCFELLTYTQTKKTMNTKNFSRMLIVDCLLTNPQNTNGFLSHGTDLVLNLFRKTFMLTYKNLNCYFLLSENHMHYRSEKCVSGLWFVVAAL